MERFHKTFAITTPGIMSTAHDMFNDMIEWLNTNVSSTDESASGVIEDKVLSGEVRQAAKLLMGYLRIRGERTEIMAKARFICYGIGEGWQVVYLSSDDFKEAEIAMCIDDAALAVQLRLIFS